jgi:hypothetical protein
MTRAAPDSLRSWALADCSPFPTGSGIKSANVPTAANSAHVKAPLRAITNSLAV